MEDQTQAKINTACHVAEEFTKLYYESMDRKRHRMSRFYMDSGSLIWNGIGQIGVDAVQKFLEDLPPSEFRLLTLDAQPITYAVQGHTFLIQVSGTVSFSGETKPFQQVFVITAQGDKWKIVSDNFRVQEPVESLFQKLWKCQHSSKNKNKKSLDEGIDRVTNRNLKCSASLNVKIKKVNTGTKKNDDYLKRPIPLQAVITVNARHTHNTTCADALRLLRLGAETKADFFMMFSDGMSPPEARRLHESKLFLKEKAIELISNSNTCL